MAHLGHGQPFQFHHMIIVWSDGWFRLKLSNTSHVSVLLNEIMAFDGVLSVQLIVFAPLS